MKLAIIVGTRPEIIRLSATIKKARTFFDVTLIHTGQNYDKELNDVFFTDLSLDTPDKYLDCSKDTVGSAVGDIIKKSYELLLLIKPDALLILGDTNSCLSAYSAKRLKIPIFHLEAGNRCRDPNVPEEVNRKIIDHLADINMCYMEHARHNLLSEGVRSEYLFVVGSPMKEVLTSILPKINSSTVLDQLNLKQKQYVLLSTHREENINNEENFNHIVNSIRQIEAEFQIKVLISVHPRTRKMFEEKQIQFSDNVILSKPFGLIDYCCLQKNSACVISDSGTVTEEASILQFPAVLLRTSTEHPEGIDAGNIILGDIKWSNLKQNIIMAFGKQKWNAIPDYMDSNFSDKVCGIISGYTSIINKFVWMKN